MPIRTTLAATRLLVGALLAPMAATCADKKSTIAEAKSIATKALQDNFEAQANYFDYYAVYKNYLKYKFLSYSSNHTQGKEKCHESTDEEFSF